MEELVKKCVAETGMEPPKPQWEGQIYGPHVGVKYVQDWYKRGKELGYGIWDV